MITEFDVGLDDRAGMRSLYRTLPELFAGDIGEAIRRHVEQHGFLDPLSGPIAPRKIKIEGDNYRESVVADRINARQRAVILGLQDALGLRLENYAVYASEGVSPLAYRLRRSLPGFVGSEYLPEKADRRAHPGIQHQNILALSFKDRSFDAYVSCDVLEHVPDLDGALREAARILKPGGVFLGTVPFAAGKDETVVKARLNEAGEVEHLCEPEYHGNPTRPDEGSLVYQVPGWDLLDRLRDAGFARAQIRLQMSQRYGVFGSQTSFLPGFLAIR